MPLIVKRKLYNGSVVRLQMGASWHNFKSDEPQMNVLVEVRTEEDDGARRSCVQAGKYMRIKVPQCLNIVVATCSGVLNLHTEQSIGVRERQESEMVKNDDL